MAHCEDCGTKLNGGICPYCDEELHILQYQGDCIDEPLSDEFMKKADDQILKIKEREKND